ncbi:MULTISPECIES: hypothetical protein [Bacillus cereus group]
MIKSIYNKVYSYNILLLGGIIMSFASWSILLPTLIGAMSGAIFGIISSRNKRKNSNYKLNNKI